MAVGVSLIKICRSSTAEGCSAVIRGFDIVVPICSIGALLRCSSLADFLIKKV